MKKKFVQHLHSRFSNLEIPLLENLINDNLISPLKLELPREIISQASNIIKSFHALREKTDYRQYLEREISSKKIQDPGNKSLFMSYDFHLNATNELKLIEINTNAAFLGLGAEVYTMLELENGCGFDIRSMKSDFESELKLQGKSSLNPSVVIIDEHPKEQRLFVEFLYFKELINSFGWNCDILDFSDSQVLKADLVYNRYTDFYFENPESLNLRDAFLKKSICFSPNPYEYLLLADKNRMVDWSSEVFWKKIFLEEEKKQWILKCLPQTKSVNELTPEYIWENRKRLFFKPKNSFGSKQTYRGANVSKKIFDEILNGQFICQEFIPAPEVNLTTPDGDSTFKFDLRCYAYQDKLQLIMARIFQGQVTNLKTKWGGFAPIYWKNTDKPTS